jgi:hypothetical protein
MDWKLKMTPCGRVMNASFHQYLESHPVEKQTLIKWYEDGYGLKKIAQMISVSGWTYALLRRFFLQEGVLRRGQNVVTPKTRLMRSQKVRGAKNPFYRWTENPRYVAKIKRFNCGWYQSPIAGAVFLRSSYEWIMAMYLDSQQIHWKFEVRDYVLPNGETYRPDFFIYSINGDLEKVIEVKSRYTLLLRGYKVDLLRKVCDTPIELVSDILPYAPNHLNSIEKCQLGWKRLCELQKTSQ